MMPDRKHPEICLLGLTANVCKCHNTDFLWSPANIKKLLRGLHITGNASFNHHKRGEEEKRSKKKPRR